MSEQTQIAWADATWNPWQGCHKISEGCQNCYAYRGMKQFGRDPTKVVRSKDPTFYAPLKWKEPKRIFVCSWSDFFIEEADEWRRKAMEIIWEKASWHTYLILTKRSEQLRYTGWPKNVWLGVTVENQRNVSRIEDLGWAICNTRFVSFEPLLGPIDLSRWKATLIEWVIVGGESGPSARPMNPEWALQIRDWCRDKDVPFFFKQHGGTKKIDGAYGGALLDGQLYQDYPRNKQEWVNADGKNILPIHYEHG